MRAVREATRHPGAHATRRHVGRRPVAPRLRLQRMWPKLPVGRSATNVDPRTLNPRRPSRTRMCADMCPIEHRHKIEAAYGRLMPARYAALPTRCPECDSSATMRTSNVVGNRGFMCLDCDETW